MRPPQREHWRDASATLPLQRKVCLEQLPVRLESLTYITPPALPDDRQNVRSLPSLRPENM